MSAIFTSAVKLMVVTFYACFITAIINTISVDNLVTEKDATVAEISAHPDGNFKNLQEFMAAIKMVETSGNPEAYITPSMDGWGYGAYQISYENWDSWCENAGITDIPPMPWPEDSSAWYTSYGDRSIPYTGDWHNVLPPAPNPWPPSVQDAVATHKMGEYYANYGSWEKVAYAWNGGPGRADNPIPQVREYWQKVCGASGSLKKRMHTLNFTVVLLLATFCVFFLIIGDRVLTMIRQYLGGGGWIFTQNDKFIMNVKRTAERDIGFLRKFIFMLCVVVVGFFVGSSSTMIYAYAIRGIDYPYDPDNYYSPTSISWADSAPSPFALSDLAGQGGSVFDYTRYIKSVAYYKNFSEWHELIKQKLGIDTDALQHSDESTKEKIAEQYANLASNISTSHSSNYDSLPDYMTTDYIDVDGTKYKQQSNYLNDTFVNGVAAAQLNVNNSQDV